MKFEPRKATTPRSETGKYDELLLAVIAMADDQELPIPYGTFCPTLVKTENEKDEAYAKRVKEEKVRERSMVNGALSMEFGKNNKWSAKTSSDTEMVISLTATKKKELVPA
jgi:hypothetical protein